MAPAAERIRSSDARARAGPSSAAGSTGATGSTTASCTAGTVSSPPATGSGSSEEPAAASSAASAITSRAASSAGTSVGISAGGGSMRVRLLRGRVAGALGSGAASPTSPSGVGGERVSRTSRATLRIAPARRSRGIAAAGTRAVKPWTMASRWPTAPPRRAASRVAAAALAGLGADDDGHALAAPPSRPRHRRAPA